MPVDERTKKIVTDGLTPGGWGYPKVAGKCPACGSESLFLASGGYVTCAVIPCKNPCAAADLLLA